MVEHVQTQVAADKQTVSADDYMEYYAHDFYEWAQGELIKMNPVLLPHDLISAHIRQLLTAFFALRPIGRVVGAPFVMRVDATEACREPDLQIILTSNPGQLTESAMIGPADICIEIVSPESVTRDYGEKFAEYERGGVREYWIFDPQRQAALLYRQNDDGLYRLQTPDGDGHYQTPLLPDFVLHVPTLWTDPLPDYFAIADAVRAMVKPAAD